MFEQDYIMRQIKEMVAVIMKAVFGAELESADTVTAHAQSSGGGENDTLFRMIDSGRIREAERMLFDSIDAVTAANLLKGFTFYQYLAQLDDDFLEAHDYSRNEIEEGVKRLAALFGAADIASLFFPD